MWWFSRKSRFVLLLAALSPLLAGCGFSPLYSRAETNKDIIQAFSEIRIERIEDRIGQQLRNNLLERLTPLGEPAKPNYRLMTTVRTSTESLGIRKDETSTRANLHVSVNFILYDSNRQAIFSGGMTVISSYNILEQVFSSTIAEKEAEARAVREAADAIRAQLASYFTDPEAYRRQQRQNRAN